MDVQHQLERERRKLKEAKGTITNLISNIGEYKKVLDQEKSALQSELNKRKASFEQEKQRFTKMISTLEGQKQVIREAYLGECRNPNCIV